MKKCQGGIYNEATQMFKLVNTQAEDTTDRIINGNVYINHRDKEVRIYNFQKSEITNEEKTNILFGILEECVLYPNCKSSREAKFGDIETYNLLINGYLTDGTFKERDKKYPSIATEFVEGTFSFEGEAKISKDLREKVKSLYEKYKDKLGKEVVEFNVTSASRITTYYELVNICILLNAYLADKDIDVVISLMGNIFAKSRDIIIRPKKVKAWK